MVGNCGFSVAPALPGRAGMLRDYLAASAPWLAFHETTFAAYMESFPATAVNTVMQVGHNTLRLMAMGMENRLPSTAELALMQDLLAEALEAGVLGLSSGLFTAPGCYAAPAEMHALGQVLHRYGANYSSHIRDEANSVFAAVQEAITMGETCDIHVQIAHLKLSGSDNWGRAAQLLAAIEAARQRGVRLDCDHIPTQRRRIPSVICCRPGCRRMVWRPCSSAWQTTAGADTLAARHRRTRAEQFWPDSIMGRRAYRYLPAPAAVRRANRR